MKNVLISSLISVFIASGAWAQAESGTAGSGGASAGASGGAYAGAGAGAAAGGGAAAAGAAAAGAATAGLAVGAVAAAVAVSVAVVAAAVAVSKIGVLAKRINTNPEVGIYLRVSLSRVCDLLKEIDLLVLINISSLNGSWLGVIGR